MTDEEYEAVLDHADDLGFERMWWQQGGTVSESFVPPSMPPASTAPSSPRPRVTSDRA